MTRQPVSHGGFTIERTYAASPARVFAALSDIEIKARWFIGPEGYTQLRREMNFEPGGSEILQGRFPNGTETLYTARFHHIVNDERIVYVYDMHLNGVHHSLSLATVEIEPVGAGTRLIFTEQIAYLDGANGVEGTAAREHGVGWHLDLLGDALRRD
jgi:uncharacterized protein YndB with AHSA1/START domain